MNEDTWQNLDTWERRDHELIREYLNDVPVWFGERELKAWMNNSEMMGYGESIWKDSWIAPDGWKEFSQSKTIMRGWHQAKTMNLEENGARYGGKTLLRSSNVENDNEKHHHELLRYSERIKRGKVVPKMKIIWKRPWRRHVIDENSFLRQTWKWIWELLLIIRRVR